MKNNLIRTSAECHRCVRLNGSVEYFVERYADPRKPRVTKLWVVNGEFAFKKQSEAFNFTSKLADEVGGGARATNGSYNTVIKSYSKSAYAKAFPEKGTWPGDQSYTAALLQQRSQEERLQCLIGAATI